MAAVRDNNLDSSLKLLEPAGDREERECDDAGGELHFGAAGHQEEESRVRILAGG